MEYTIVNGKKKKKKKKKKKMSVRGSSPTEFEQTGKPKGSMQPIIEEEKDEEDLPSSRQPAH